MAYDHYLKHQPKRDSVVSWFLLVTIVSFLAGFLLSHVTANPGRLVAPLILGSAPQIVTSNAVPGWFGASEAPEMLW